MTPHPDPAPVRDDRLPRKVQRVLVVATVAATVWYLLLPARASPDTTTIPMALAIAGAVAFVVLSARAPLVSARWIAAGTAVSLAVAVIRPPFGSHDLWSYAAYGRILGVHHHNPYVVAPADFIGRDRTMHRVAVRWRPTRSVYGPLFTLISAALSLAVGRSALLTRLAFQGIAAASIAAAMWILHRRRASVSALAVLGLNPLVLIAVVNGGHNDALVGLLVLAAACTLERRPRWAAIGLAVAASIKLVAALAVPALVVWCWRRRRQRQAVELVAIVSGMLVAGYLAFGGLRALRPLLTASGMESRVSLPQLALGDLRPVSDARFGLIALAGMLALALALWWRVRPATLAATASVPLMAYLFAGRYVLPWYFAWVLPLAALDWSWRPSRIVAGYSTVLLLAYQYRVERHPDHLDQVLNWVLRGCQVSAFLFIAALLWPTPSAQGPAQRSRWPSTTS